MNTEKIEKKIAIYLADEVYLAGTIHNSNDIEVTSNTTPIPEQAKDILDLVLQSLDES